MKTSYVYSSVRSRPYRYCCGINRTVTLYSGCVHVGIVCLRGLHKLFTLTFLYVRVDSNGFKIVVKSFFTLKFVPAAPLRLFCFVFPEDLDKTVLLIANSIPFHIIELRLSYK
jgi:hypothetical protein